MVDAAANLFYPNAFVRPVWRTVLYGSLLYDIWLRSYQPVRLRRSAPDSLPGDAGNGKRLLVGRIRFGAETKDANLTPDLFDDMEATSTWRVALHSFGWVRDLHATGDDRARRVAQDMLRAWLRRFDRWDSLAWRADVIGRRLMMWLMHTDFLLEGTDLALRRRFAAHMGRQVRHLVSEAALLLQSPARVWSYAGLLAAALVCGNGQMYRARAERGLLRTIERQILPDGCHISRRPDAILDCLTALVLVRAIYVDVEEPFPDKLLVAIERMAPMIRFFQTGDKALVPFHGGGIETSQRVSQILKLAKANGKPPSMAPYGGYYRLFAGNVTVLMDVHAPPEIGSGATPHAAIGALHVCVGKHRLISSCGMAPASDRTLDQVLRSSAAHSVFELLGHDMAAFDHEGGAATDAKVTEQNFTLRDGHSLAVVAHNGYAAQGYKVRRSVYLDPDGMTIKGEETIVGALDVIAQDFAIRFHLHPSVKVLLVESGRAAILRVGSSLGWRLRIANGVLHLEDSLHVAADGIRRRSQQLIIKGRVGAMTLVVKWALQAFNGK